MSAVSVLDDLMDRLLPDTRMESDWRTYVSRRGQDGALELMFNGRRSDSVSVPIDASVHVYVKGFVTDPYSLGFGQFVAYASVGKLTVPSTNILEAEYCFATFYYAHDMDLIRIEFHRDYFSFDDE